MTLTGDVDVRARGTYRYVQIIMVVPAVWLLASIAVVWIWRGELLDSISDYYGGPMRDVFVGGLMACGICMVAYKGRSNLEDYALNFAGLNAFFVALVPNSFPKLLADARKAEREGVDLPVSSAQLQENLQIAVGVFLAVVLLFVVVDALLLWKRFDWRAQSTLANAAIVVSCAAEVVLLGFVVAMVVGVEEVNGGTIYTIVHFVAAALLILNLSFVAATNAFGRLHKDAVVPTDVGAPPALFRTVTVLMWAGIVVGGLAIWRDVDYAVIVTEIWEIVLFLVFWVAATRHEWTRSAAQAAAPRAQPAVGAVPQNS